MLRYEDADESLVSVFLDIMEERFPQYQYLNFKLVYDLKKRISGGKIVLANIELASPKIKYFSQDDKAAEGYDYVLFVDKKAWELSSEQDRKRLISHELRHVFIDEKDNPKIIGHEIEDFYAEIRLNEDDPEWGRKLSRLVADVYDQEKDMAKEKKSNN
jgi:hypothetical protein